MIFNKILILTSLAFSYPSFIYYFYIVNLEEKIRKYKENLELLNNKIEQIDKKYNDLIKILNINFDKLSINEETKIQTYNNYLNDDDIHSIEDTLLF